jgi:hypothetical protein
MFNFISCHLVGRLGDLLKGSLQKRFKFTSTPTHRLEKISGPRGIASLLGWQARQGNSFSVQ